MKHTFPFQRIILLLIILVYNSFVYWGSRLIAQGMPQFKNKEYVPVWYRVCSCIMALAVCVSTLTAKQHVGLSIAENIIKHHKGKIWAESSSGINTFYIELPTHF